jgi:hypothetical protein
VCVFVRGPEIGDIEAESEEPDLANEAVISDAGRRGYSASVEGKHIGNFSDRDAAFRAVRQWMRKHNVNLNIYFVNERGTVDQLHPHTGDFLSGAPPRSRGRSPRKLPQRRRR